MSVQCIEPKFYAEFLSLLGLSDDPDYRRQFDKRLWPALCQRTADIFLTRTVAEWAALFEGTDACVAAVNDPWQAARHPHLQARGTWISDAESCRRRPRRGSAAGRP